MKFRSPGTLGTKRKKKRKKKKSSSQSLRVRGALSEPGAIGVQSVTTLNYLYITHPRIQLPNRSDPGICQPPEFILMFKHMLICPNEARVLITGWPTVPFERSRTPKNTYHKKHCNSSSSPTLWFLLPFTSLLLSRLAIAVDYRGQNRDKQYEILSHALPIDGRCHWPGSSKISLQRQG